MEDFNQKLWDKSDIFIKQIQEKFGDKVDCHDYANLKVYIDYLISEFIIGLHDGCIYNVYLKENHYQLIHFKNYIFEHFIGEK